MYQHASITSVQYWHYFALHVHRIAVHCSSIHACLFMCLLSIPTMGNVHLPMMHQSQYHVNNPTYCNATRKREPLAREDGSIPDRVFQFLFGVLDALHLLCIFVLIVCLFGRGLGCKISSFTFIYVVFLSLYMHYS